MGDRPLSSRRPYLLRAMREWMLDNGLTPHIVVDVSVPGVDVPEAFVRDGRIILNVSDTATEAMLLGNERVEFSARFGGTPRAVSVPVGAILGIYARETEQGMVFGLESPGASGDGEGDDAPPEDDGPGGGGRPHLKVVK